MRRSRTRQLVRALLLLFGLGLAVAATAALVLTEDLQLLRLAVIAALWAFLIAAFVAGQRRSGDATGTPEPGAEVGLRRTFELELEREVAKRHEYELRAEVRLRREVEGTLKEDLAAVRGDLDQLRHDILERWDGELRVERIAVRAESRRVSGFGATFQALQGEAQRHSDEGRPLFEVESAQPRRDELETASTVEFSVIPPAPTVDDVVAAARAPASGSHAAEPLTVENSSASRRSRARHQAQQTESVDASALLRRLEPETRPALEPAARRRRYRDDDETNDVLARVLGDP